MSTNKIVSIKAIPLMADFAKIYGGVDKIPPEIKNPASHFQDIPRLGQYTSLVIIESSDGSIGYGECFGLPTPHPAAEIVNRVIAPALINKEIREPKELLESVRKFCWALGHTKGPAMEAISGVDTALWDLLARSSNVTLSEYLGAEPTPIKTYISPIPFFDAPEKTASFALDLVGNFKGVKLKIGRGSKLDLPHIKAVRACLSEDIDLMLDANCGYDLPDALNLVRGLEGMNIAWLEEPLPTENIEELRILSGSTDVPIAAGENEFTVKGLMKLVSSAGVKIVQPNVSRCGGVSALLELDDLAEEHKFSISPHGVGASIVLATTLQVGAAMKHFQSFEINRLPNPMREQLGSPSIFLNNGMALPPKGLGHGSQVHETQISNFKTLV